MDNTLVIHDGACGLRIDLRVLLAFGAIYLLWGATFLAIRVAVLEIPPLFTAGLRFFVAGILLHVFMRLRGAPNPSALQWRNLGLIGLCMFVATYGPLFWAEQYVSSSITAIIEATLPITTVMLEVFVFRSQPLQWRVIGGVVLGFSGVAVLVIHNGGQHLARIPCMVILAAGIAWSLGAVLSSRLKLPPSRPLVAGTEMLLGGGVLLVLSGAAGEMHPFPHIAVALGYFAAGEIITVRSIVASILVVASVFLILSRNASDAPRGDAARHEFISADLSN